MSIDSAPDAARTMTLSELLGALSHALDMTEGLPPGHSARAAFIAMRCADEMGISGQTRRDLFYSVLLKDAGCSSNAARLCEIYQADDLKLKRDFRTVGPSLADTLRYVLTQTAPDQGIVARTRAILNIMRNASTLVTELIETRCHRGADIVRRLHLAEEAAKGVASLDEHWDGKGKPEGLKGEDVPLFSRLALLSQVAEVFHATEGRAAALDECRRRSGTWFDPAVVAAFERAAARDVFWTALEDGAGTRVLAEAAVGETFVVDEDYLDDVAEAFADVVDAKSPYTAGHSRRVAFFADTIAETVGLDAERRRRLRRAALLHDVGKLGVSNSVLEKPGKLDDAEWIAMRSHAAKSEAILRQINVFAEAAHVGGAHHERLDGSGYPRGLRDNEINLETRIVSVADVFDALTANRPYRDAMPAEKALAIIEADVGRAFDPTCVAALRLFLAEPDALAEARLELEPSSGSPAELARRAA